MQGVREASLVSRLRRLVVAIVVTTSLAIGWLGYSTAESVAREEARQWLGDAVAVYESLLAEFLEDFQNTVKAVASNTSVEALVERHAGGRIDPAELHRRCRPILLDHVNDTAGVVAILLTDRTGKVVTASDDRHLTRVFGGHPDFIKGLVEHHVSEPILTGNKYHAYAAGPLRSSREEVLGVIIAMFDWTTLVRVITSPQRLGATGEVSVGSRQGDLINILVPGDDHPSISIPLRPGSITGRAVLGESGFVETVDHRGKEVLAAFRPAGKSHWGLVVKINTAEAFRNVRRLRWILAGSALLLVVLAMSATHVLARRIVHPIQMLTHQAARIADGDLAARAEVVSVEEIDELARHFNRMAENLAASHATLEQKVELRTRELERAHEQLRVAAKMEAVGTLAAGVAHHFSNLVQVIIGHAEAFETVIPPGHSHRRALETVFRTADRASELVRQLLRYARRDASEARLVDANVIVQETLELVRSFVPRSIHFEVKLSELPAVVRADPRELEELLVNLAINARDAMPDGGQLGVAVAVGEGDAGGGRVTIQVRDTGCGMDEETRAHVFEPFYTTKGPDHGTGLGLALVYGIVRRSGGAIDVQSEVGGGTRVAISFPLAPSDAVLATTLLPDEVCPDEVGTLDGDETVLVVEAHEELRDVLVQRITDRGYTALEAGCGEDALAIARDWTEPLHLIITDISLPDTPGEELVSRLRSARPDVPVLYLVGQRHDPGHGSAPIGSTLSKPFRIPTLLRRIKTLLTKARGPTSGDQ